MQLTIENLSKTYANGVQALKNVTLDIPTGMFGLLGPNGAGKSSLMRTLATLQQADSGKVFLGDTDVLNNKEEVRKMLGYLPQEFGVYPRVSAETMLDQFAQLKGITNSRERKEITDALLQKTNLYSFRKRNLGTYSGGMKQRFGIAQALLGNPRLIIVDEPTAGLDPSERNRFHNLLSEIGENIVVILSTHIIEDVQSLCSSMAIINKGEVLLSGKPAGVIEGVRGRIWRKVIDRNELAAYSHLRVISNRLSGGRTEINVFSESLPENGFVHVEPDLEDVYFSSIHQN
jgi:ABC-2 type transport system ATP-binding protein